MTDFEKWQQANDSYLAAALEWLRLRLTRLIPSPPAAEPAALAAQPLGRAAKSKKASRQKARVSQKSVTAGRRPAAALPPAPRGSDRVIDQQVAAAFDRMTAAQRMDPPPALILLQERLGMEDYERNVLLLAAATELDTGLPALCARAQDDPSKPYPTFALAMALFDDPLWEAMAPERPLRYWRLIEINQPGAQPLTASALRADERIVNHVKGLSHIDDRVMPFLVPFDMPPHAAPVPASQEAVAREIVRAVERQQATTIHLLGSDRESKQLVAGAAAESLGMALYRMPADLLPAQAVEMDTLARLWRRDALLSPVALYIDAHDLDRNADSAQNANIRRFVTRMRGLVFVDAREAAHGAGFSVDVAKPTPEEQRALWRRHLGDSSAAAATALAGQFNLSAPAIARVAAQTKEQDANGSNVEEVAWGRAAAATQPRIDTLAQRIDVRASWADLILPDSELALLHQISAQVAARARVYDEWGFRARMNRGLGIAALFAGESGTGKTMAAEVIAGDLRLPLHRIDLSAVVSKYIGETEKNVREVFERAEDGGGILFFDEADALYGKRTEVRDSHDRYANIEINYLLQRMESYRGLAILATNMKDALDTAFLRRLRFIINFPFPAARERRAIWERVFPENVPREPLDLDRLARLNITGGSIHNIALHASFLASAQGAKVSMPIVLDAARTELRKLNKPFNDSELRRDTILEVV